MAGAGWRASAWPTLCSWPLAGARWTGLQVRGGWQPPALQPRLLPPAVRQWSAALPRLLRLPPTRRPNGRAGPDPSGQGVWAQAKVGAGYGGRAGGAQGQRMLRTWLMLRERPTLLSASVIRGMLFAGERANLCLRAVLLSLPSPKKVVGALLAAAAERAGKPGVKIFQARRYPGCPPGTPPRAPPERRLRTRLCRCGSVAQCALDPLPEAGCHRTSKST